MSPIISEPKGSGGGSQPGIKRVPFVFNTASLAAGITLLVPTLDLYLLDAWIEIVTSWDNSSAGLADIGQPDINGGSGWFAFLSGTGSAIDMVGGSSSPIPGLAQGGPLPLSLCNVNTTDYQNGSRTVPSPITDVAPIKVWLSQSGLAGGTASTSAVGSGVACLRTTTAA